MSEILTNLKEAVLSYDKDAAARWAAEAMKEGIDPLQAYDALTETIAKIGDGFGKGELWLPDLVGAASAMQSATPIIQEKIKALGRERKGIGTIVMGTVFGDIHNVGKDMVSALASAQGFEVIDLGVDVPANKFVEAVVANKADILAMSALLTTTAHVQKEVIEAIKKKNLRNKVKVAVGGGAITPEFAKMVGADGYRPTAVGAAELFKSFMGIK